MGLGRGRIQWVRGILATIEAYCLRIALATVLSQACLPEKRRTFTFIFCDPLYSYSISMSDAMSDAQSFGGAADDRDPVTLAQDPATVLQANSVPMPFADPGEPTQSQADQHTEFQDPIPETPSVMSIDDWLDKLRSSDRAFYNIMAMEVWSLAKSMDSVVPGFWSRFMVNRRTAMQEFVERRRTHPNDTAASADGPPTSPEL